MDFTIEKKEKYSIVILSKDKSTGNDLLKECIPLVADTTRYPVLDFSKITKADLELLSEIEPVIKIFKRCGRKILFCCSNQTVLAVLETSGLFANTILFATVKELELHLETFTTVSNCFVFSAKENILPMNKVSKTLKKILENPNIKTSFFVLIFLFITTVLIQNFLVLKSQRTIKNSIHSINKSQDSIKALSLNKIISDEVIEELNADSLKSGKRSYNLISQIANNYEQDSFKLRKNCADFLSAQSNFYKINKKYAVNISELKWQVSNFNIQVEKFYTSDTKDYSQIILSAKTEHELVLKWSVDTKNIWQALN